MRKRLPKSVRKYIARQKSLIRVQFSNPEEIQKRIANLYQGFRSED